MNELCVIIVINKYNNYKREVFRPRANCARNGSTRFGGPFSPKACTFYYYFIYLYIVRCLYI